MSDLPIFGVDAFALSEPFTGNPAAVLLLLDDDRPDEWKQALAAEMNLSETAFVTRAGVDVFGLRWFTPAVEVDLCGHATLAAAHVLWEKGIAPEGGRIDFDTRSGRLTAFGSKDGISLDFPAADSVPAQPPMELAEGLGMNPVGVRRAGDDYLVELLSSRDIRELAPDFVHLRRVDCRGVIVTARGEGDIDFVSRFFAPAVGIDEDPVTGSAHAALAPFWARRLGKNVMRAAQLSKRGGELIVEVRGDRAIITGRAVTVWEGVVRT